MALRAAALTRKGVAGDAGALLRRLAQTTQRQFGHTVPVVPAVRRDGGQFEPSSSNSSVPVVGEPGLDSPEPAQPVPRISHSRKRSQSRSRLQHMRATSLWWQLATTFLAACVSFFHFIAASFGQGHRTQRVIENAAESLRSGRQQFLLGIKRGASLSKAMSDRALESLSQLSPGPERVRQLLKRAVSYEKHLDVKAAIRCYEVRRGRSLAPRGPALCGCKEVLKRWESQLAQAARKIEPDNSDALVGLAKATSDRGARSPSPGERRMGSLRTRANIAAFRRSQCSKRTSSMMRRRQGRWRPRRPLLGSRRALPASSLTRQANAPRAL